MLFLAIEKMPATIIPRESVDLVHHNRSDVCKQVRVISSARYEHDLQGFRRRKQNIRRIF
jgi:hypothetical protein